MGGITRLPNYDSDLSVAMVTFEGSQYMSINEMFDGFDDLKVVTYSYELGFIEQISEKFSTMTVLLGCEKIVRGDMISMILASQRSSIESIKKHGSLYARAIEGSAVFKVAKEVTSHQKIYILTARDGRMRVITGSPNFSRRGFSGLAVQGEVYTCFENDDGALRYFTSMFDFLDSMCMDEVPVGTLYISRTEDIGAEELPIAKEVMGSNVGVIVEQTYDEEAEYVTDVSKIAAQYADLSKKMKAKLDKKSDKILITPDYIRELIKIENKKREEEKEFEKRFPKLHVDYDTGSVRFDGVLYNLDDIKTEDVKEDLITLQEYFDGFDDFIGNTGHMKHTYFRMMNFMFLSPFMAMLRDTAHKAGFAEEYFPYFAILSGKKSAGKTQFVLLMQYLMTGRAIEMAPNGTWTKTQMRVSLSEVEGVPVCIDDISNDTFQRNAGNIVKCDDWLFSDKMTHHGVYVLTTNDIGTLKPELAKRIYFAPIQATQTNTEAASRKKKLVDLRGSFTMALYKKYLSKMIPLVNDMMNRMETFDSKKDGKWTPDIFEASSEVFLSMFEECEMDVPDYMRPLVYNDYFGYNEISEQIRVFIRDEWSHNKSAFTPLKKRNELEYRAGEHGYEASRVCDSLPEVLEPRRSGVKVIMKLNEAEKFFGLSFKRGPFK